MRSVWRSGAPVLLAAALLAGCSLQGSGGASSAPPDSGVAEHWSVLEGEARLPAVGTRWTSGPMEELTPSPDYGELVPYAGAGYYLVYPDGEGGTVQSPSLSTLYGLMTVDGCAVLDPVCTGIYASSYLDGQGTSHTLPVWELTRTGNGRLTALAARDGSWVTPFRYWAAAGSPLGVFAGDGTGLSLLSTETGEVLKSWTWAQLGVEDLKDFPWFANNMEATAQWAGDAFFLGIWGEGNTAHLLDPETGAVTTLSAQAWYERDGARYTAQTGWQAEAAEDGTVTGRCSTPTSRRTGCSSTITAPAPRRSPPWRERLSSQRRWDSSTPCLERMYAIWPRAPRTGRTGPCTPGTGRR